MATLTKIIKRDGSSFPLDSDFKFTNHIKTLKRTAMLGYWQDSPTSETNYYVTFRWDSIQCNYCKVWALTHEEYKTLLRYCVDTRKIRDTYSSHGSFKDSLNYFSDYGLSPMPIHALIEFYL
jgi:hypothetical protein